MDAEERRDVTNMMSGMGWVVTMVLRFGVGRRDGLGCSCRLGGNSMECN